MPSLKKSQRRKGSRTKRSYKKKQMKGGAASFNPDSLAGKYASCTSADRHNLQSSKANLDLIQGAGSMPDGYQKGGNGACPNSGESLTFKQYTDIVAQKLKNDTVPTMTGGGYAIDPAAEQIGGQPARVGYSDCCPPVSLEGSLLMGANSGAMCGQQMGGGRKKKRSKSGKKKSATLKKQLAQNTGIIQQLGGDSMQALFPGESHNGPDGNFNDTGADLDYAAKQPFWDARAR